MKIRPKICISICESTLLGVQSIVEKYSGRAQFFEVYLDYLEDHSDLSRYIASQPRRYIFTLRRPGFIPIERKIEDHLAVFHELSDADFFVDVDPFKESEIFHEVVKCVGAQRLIASFHDYEKTPSTEELEAIYIALKQTNAKIVKIATSCDDEGDIAKLLWIVAKAKEENQPLVGASMGIYGAKGRISLAINGNPWSYVSIADTVATAAGQLSLEKFEQTLEELGYT